MIARYYIQEGLIVKKQNRDDKDYAGLFSLDKWFKKILRRLHIGFVDDCCTGIADPNGTDVTNLPVRYNSETPGLEYYNPETKAWTAVS